MRKFKKVYNLIFALNMVVAFLINDYVYALRVPVAADKTTEDISLINSLSGDDVNDIDRALAELDKIARFDRHRVAEIVEKVFLNRGLRLEIQSNWINIVDIQSQDIAGYRAFDNWKSDGSDALLFTQAEIDDKYERLRGKRLFPMLYRWMPAQTEFLRYSGAQITSGTPLNAAAARAMWRSGFKDIKIRRSLDQSDITDINEIKDRESYTVTARFPNRQEKDDHNKDIEASRNPVLISEENNLTTADYKNKRKIDEERKKLSTFERDTLNRIDYYYEKALPAQEGIDIMIDELVMLLKESDEPVLLNFNGFPGTGKTVLAGAIGDSFCGWSVEYYDLDTGSYLPGSLKQKTIYVSQYNLGLANEKVLNVALIKRDPENPHSFMNNIINSPLRIKWEPKDRIDKEALSLKFRSESDRILSEERATEIIPTRSTFTGT